jgi:hypothetical protein
MAIAIPRVIARNIVFKIGSTSYAPELSNIELTLGDAPGGLQTFTEVRPSGEYSLSLTGYVSGDADSLYRLLYSSHGSEAAFTLIPGGGTEGADNPKFSGTVIFNELPPISLTANDEVQFTVTLRVKNTGHDPAALLYYGVLMDVTA